MRGDGVECPGDPVSGERRADTVWLFVTTTSIITGYLLAVEVDAAAGDQGDPAEPERVASKSLNSAA
ncbi:hypothetical protein AB0H60_23235 [Nocardia rhamnosiphila]|uniref:hypothetical protein n=1 Tax=Nocardia rhamnosiphila TaxID=426716 RepID=UPI00340641D7